MKQLLVWLVVGGLSLAGCVSSSGTEPDGQDADASDGGPDAGDPADGADKGSDSASGDDSQSGDIDLGDDFGLFIPAGLQACATGRVFTNQEDHSGSAEMTGRITFKPGVVRLYRNLDSFAADLIERIEWGYDLRVGIPVSGGRFVRDQDLFTYEQSVPVGGQIMDVWLRVWFGTWDGSPPPRVITLGEAGLVRNDIGVEGSIGNTSLYFLSCTHTIFDHSVHVYTFGDNHQLAIEACAVCPNTMCKSSIGAVERAEVTIGGIKRIVTEPLHLSLWFGQHDWYGDALVFLQEPIGDVSGLTLSFGVYPDMPGQTIQLLDRDLQVTSTVPVTHSERRDSW